MWGHCCPDGKDQAQECKKELSEHMEEIEDPKK